MHEGCGLDLTRPQFFTMNHYKSEHPRKIYPPKNTRYTVFPIMRSVRYSVIFHSCYVMLYYAYTVSMEYRINLSSRTQPNTLKHIYNLNKHTLYICPLNFLWDSDLIMNSLIQTPVNPNALYYNSIDTNTSPNTTCSETLT